MLSSSRGVAGPTSAKQLAVPAISRLSPDFSELSRDLTDQSEELPIIGVMTAF